MEDASKDGVFMETKGGHLQRLSFHDVLTDEPIMILEEARFNVVMYGVKGIIGGQHQGGE